MALGVLSWDLPPAERMEAYNEGAKVWISTVLKQPGVKEFRAYRNFYRTTPHVMTHTEFDSLESWLNFLKSDDYAAIVNDMLALGCTNLSAEVWDVSPVAPEPLKPTNR